MRVCDFKSMLTQNCSTWSKEIAIAELQRVLLTAISTPPSLTHLLRARATSIRVSQWEGIFQGNTVINVLAGGTRHEVRETLWLSRAENKPGVKLGNLCGLGSHGWTNVKSKSHRGLRLGEWTRYDIEKSLRKKFRR